MLEVFENGSMDIISLLVIIYCISIAYRKRYSLTGYLYVKEQLNLLSAYCMVFVIVMYILLIIGLPLWIIIRGVILLFRRKISLR